MNKSTNEIKAVVKRNTPGRPRLDKNKKSLTKEGVVSETIIKNSIMELTHDNPYAFKKIFTLFDLLNIKDIRIEFRERHVYIKTCDYLEKNNILLKIDCSKVVRYYCKHSFDIHLDPKNIQNVIKKLDKQYTTISFISYESSFTNDIILLFYRDDIKMHEKHTITLIDNNCIDNKRNDMKYDLSYKNYLIDFTLNSKIFKKIINDINIFSDVLTIHKTFNSKLTIEYSSSDNTIKSKNLFENDDNIKLRSNLIENQIFSVSTKIEYIKPISSALISDNIVTYLDPNKNIVFNIQIDNSVFDLLIYTHIIRF